MPPRGNKKGARKRANTARVPSPEDTAPESTATESTAPEHTEEPDEPPQVAESEDPPTDSRVSSEDRRPSTPPSQPSDGEDYDDAESRSNNVTVFRAEVEQKLVEFIASKPIFYDHKRKDFHNTARKNSLYDDKGRELGISGKDIQKWLKSCRTTFGRLKKRKSGAADAKMTNRQSWIWRNFQFLKEHIAKKANTLTLGKIAPAASASTSTAASSVSASTSSSTHTPTGRRNTLHDLDSDDDLIVESPSILTDPSPQSSKSGAKKSRLGQQQQDTLAKLVDVIAESRVGEANLTQQMLGQKQGRATVWGQALIHESEAINNQWWGAYQAESINLVNKYRHLSQGLLALPVASGYPTDYTAAGPAISAQSTGFPAAQSTAYAAQSTAGPAAAQSTAYPAAAQCTAYQAAAHATSTSTVQHPGPGTFQGGRQSATSTGQFLGGAYFEQAMRYENLSVRPGRSTTAPGIMTPSGPFGDPNFSFSPSTYNAINTPTSQSGKGLPSPPGKE